MDYNKLAEKWLRAETSLEEEKMLREHKADEEKVEERAISAYINHNQELRRQSVEITTHRSRPYWAMTSAIGVCIIALMVALGVHHNTTTVTEQTNVYCYINGEEITSEQEAHYYAQQVMHSFENEAFAEADFLGSLFTLK